MDAKTKHLVALAASLGEGAIPELNTSLAVASKRGASRQEMDEVVVLAMTVGAHKIRLMA